MNMPDTFGLLNIETFKSNCLVGNHSLRQIDLHLYLAVLKGTEAPEAEDVRG